MEKITLIPVAKILFFIFPSPLRGGVRGEPVRTFVNGYMKVLLAEINSILTEYPSELHPLAISEPDIGVNPEHHLPLFLITENCS